ncbi:unnamed protein product [Amoebophrya sp. A25]|nr:unnamed protein product [Amoebophrya sp. A25]|eukprot:GSA25T00014894001.1
MVDIQKIEESKENILPLRTGRDLHQLEKSDLEAEITKFEADIRNEKHPDALGTWHAYAKWWQQNSSSSSSSASSSKGHLGFHDVLQQGTQKFWENEKAHSDYRYLALWLMYGESCLKDSIDMFPFLWANGVGTQFGLLYMAWASVLEKARRFRDVEDVYKMGVARRAQPLPKLEEDYKRFRIRMVERVRRDLQQHISELSSLTDEQLLTDERVRRRAFAELSKREARDAMAGRPVFSRNNENAQQQQGPPIGNFGWGTSSSSTAARIGNNARTSTMQVFEDDDDGQHRTLFDSEAEWKKLPFPASLESHASFRPENVKKTAPNWGSVKPIPVKGQNMKTLSQQAGAGGSTGSSHLLQGGHQGGQAGAAAPQFEMFCDDEFMDDGDSQPQPQKTSRGLAGGRSRAPLGGFGRILEDVPEELDESSRAATPGAPQVVPPSASSGVLASTSTSASTSTTGGRKRKNPFAAMIEEKAPGKATSSSSSSSTTATSTTDAHLQRSTTSTNVNDHDERILKQDLHHHRREQEHKQHAVSSTSSSFMQERDHLNLKKPQPGPHVEERSRELTLAETSGPLPVHHMQGKSRFVYGFLPTEVSIEEVKAEKWWDMYKKLNPHLMDETTGFGGMTKEVRKILDPCNNSRDGSAKKGPPPEEELTFATKRALKDVGALFGDGDTTAVEQPALKRPKRILKAQSSIIGPSTTLPDASKSQPCLGKQRSKDHPGGGGRVLRPQISVPLILDQADSSSRGPLRESALSQPLPGREEIMMFSASCHKMNASQEYSGPLPGSASRRKLFGAASGLRSTSGAAGGAGAGGTSSNGVGLGGPGGGASSSSTAPSGAALGDRMLRPRSPASANKRGVIPAPGSVSKCLLSNSRAASPANSSLNNSSAFAEARQHLLRRASSDENEVPPPDHRPGGASSRGGHSLLPAVTSASSFLTSGAGGGPISGAELAEAASGVLTEGPAIAAGSSLSSSFHQAMSGVNHTGGSSDVGTGGGFGSTSSSSSSWQTGGPSTAISSTSTNNGGRIISGLSPRNPRGGGLLFGARAQLPYFRGRSNSGPGNNGQPNTGNIADGARSRDGSGGSRGRRPRARPGEGVNVTGVTRATNFEIYEEDIEPPASSSPPSSARGKQRASCRRRSIMAGAGVNSGAGARNDHLSGPIIPSSNATGIEGGATSSTSSRINEPQVDPRASSQDGFNIPSSSNALPASQQEPLGLGAPLGQPLFGVDEDMNLFSQPSAGAGLGGGVFSTQRGAGGPEPSPLRNHNHRPRCSLGTIETSQQLILSPAVVRGSKHALVFESTGGRRERMSVVPPNIESRMEQGKHRESQRPFDVSSVGKMRLFSTGGGGASSNFLTGGGGGNSTTGGTSVGPPPAGAEQRAPSERVGVGGMGRLGVPAGMSSMSSRDRGSIVGPSSKRGVFDSP